MKKKLAFFLLLSVPAVYAAEFATGSVSDGQVAPDMAMFLEQLAARVNEAEEARTVAETKLVHMENDLRSMRSNYEEQIVCSEGLLEAAQEENKKLASSVSQMGREKESLTASSRALEDAIQQNTTEIVRLTAEVAKQKDELVKQAGLVQEHMQTIQELQVFKDQSEQGNKERERLAKRVQELEAVLHESLAAIAKTDGLQQQVDELVAANKHKDEQIERLQKDLQDFAVASPTRSSSLHDSVVAAGSLGDELGGALAAQASHAATQALEAKIADLQGTIAGLHGKLEAAQREQQSTRDLNQTLLQQMAGTTGLNSKLESEKRVLTAQIEEIKRASASEKATYIAQAQASVAAQLRVIQDMKTEKARIEEVMRALTVSADETSRRVAALEKELATVTAERDRIKRELTESTSAKADLQASFAQSERSLAAAKLEIQRLNVTDGENKRAIAALNSTGGDNAKLQTEIAGLQARIATIQTELRVAQDATQRAEVSARALRLEAQQEKAQAKKHSDAFTRERQANEVYLGDITQLRRQLSEQAATSTSLVDSIQEEKDRIAGELAVAQRRLTEQGQQLRERIRDLEQRYHGLTADNTGLQARVREANDLLDRNRREMAVLETLRIRISTFSQDPQFAQKAKNILDNIDVRIRLLESQGRDKQGELDKASQQSGRSLLGRALSVLGGATAQGPQDLPFAAASALFQGAGVVMQGAAQRRHESQLAMLRQEAEALRSEREVFETTKEVVQVAQAMHQQVQQQVRRA